MPDKKISRAGEKGAQKDKSQSQYEDWPKDDLMQRAQEAGIEGHTEMSKEELVRALRDQ